MEEDIYENIQRVKNILEKEVDDNPILMECYYILGETLQQLKNT